jgi:hypothetical protein
MIEPLKHYATPNDFERRLESIALVFVKQRALGEKTDLKFHEAARAFGLDDEVMISRIRRRVLCRWKVIRRLKSPCIFAEADRIAGLRLG